MKFEKAELVGKYWLNIKWNRRVNFQYLMYALFKKLILEYEKC